MFSVVLYFKIFGVHSTARRQELAIVFERPLQHRLALLHGCLRCSTREPPSVVNK